LQKLDGTVPEGILLRWQGHRTSHCWSQCVVYLCIMTLMWKRNCKAAGDQMNMNFASVILTYLITIWGMSSCCCRMREYTLLWVGFCPF